MKASVRRPMAMQFAAVFWSLGIASTAIGQTACTMPAWSSEGPIDVFAGYLPKFQTGQALPKDGTFSLALVPTAEVYFLVQPPPDRLRGRGGAVTIERIPAGQYRIVMSDEAEVDAVQDYTRLPSIPVLPDPACVGIRWILEIAADDGPLTLQFTTARTELLKIAILPVSPPAWKW